MKMRLIPVLYHGFTAMDRRFSIPMLPWIVSEIRKRESYEKLSLGIEDGHLQAYNSDFEIQFSHNLSRMTRFSQADLDPSTFLYLLRDENEQLLFCYLFQALKCSDVIDLYQQMKENTTTAYSSTKSNGIVSNLTTLPADISPSSSNFFEVLYIGKIKVWNKKVPNTFIDDSIEKFKAHDSEKARKRLEKLNESNRRGSIDIQTFPKRPQLLQRSQSVIGDIALKSPDVDCTTLNNRRNNVNTKNDDVNNPNANDDRDANDLDANRNLKKELTKKTEVDNDHNRTMVLQIDRTDLRLISPDRKVILLQKHHRDITTCLQGVQNNRHFGFVSKEGNSLNTFIGYVFKCESSSIATEVVSAITQSFNSVENKPKPTVVSCEHCPMVWFHKLCCEIENLSDKKTQATIIRRIETLDEEEQTIILTKYRGVETDSQRDQNELLMMLLRAHCEMKQGRHVHDTIENRSEFLSHYLGGGSITNGNTIFMKAKRSLTTSFDSLLKRRPSKDDLNLTAKEMVLPINENKKQSLDEKEKDKNGNLSPMMDIFLKVGSPKESPNKLENESYRQAIFKRVITPSKPHKINKKRTREELRELWKNSIRQAILLIRMEKENARLKAEQEESKVKRIKLEYDELKLNLINDDFDFSTKDIRGGIPKAKRGEVWNCLAEKYENKKIIDEVIFPNFNVAYEDLLKQLTSHQHAILIDLGRTYPSHPYYKSPLGPGQLALFNLLKAYSLLDPEVGYCQGLSFVAGVLLLHMEESQAFSLLRHLMFERDLRKQYLPDMIGLQIKLYQLSRLLHDKLPDLYRHFDEYEVAPTLYAAPWLLTMFASQFPLGFVSRIFDMIFLDEPEVVFKVSFAILTYYKNQLLQCESFEEIMNVLKVKLPQMSGEVLDEIIKEVSTMDLSRQLNEYQVEYSVLQEEMQNVQPQMENLEGLNKKLKEENGCLKSEIEVLNIEVNRLEQVKMKQISQINNLITQNRGLEVTVTALSSFINSLDEKVDIPGDIRRILAQIEINEKRKNPLFKNSNKRVLVKSLSTGRISESKNGFFEKSYKILQRQRTVSENDEIETQNESAGSSTNSIDSGVYTPGSPKEIIKY